MRARSAFFAGAGSVAILAIGWQAGVGTLVSSLPASAPVASGTTTSANGTYNGQTVSTRFGTVQVNAVISGGQITDVVAVKLTDNARKSVSISNQAAPMIRQEVLSAQSAKVSNIGGATYTTKGYLMSLQSALDAAGFTG